MAVKKDTSPALVRVVSFHGIDLTQTGEAYQGECPFCQKPNHFYIHPGKDRGEPKFWKCHYCDSKGNIYSFLQQLHAASLEQTSPDAYKELWREKRISPAAAKVCKLAKSVITEEWLFPALNKESKVVNLYRWAQSKNKLFGSPTLPTPLFGLNNLSDDTSIPVWIAEGHWDYAILEHVFRSLKIRKENDVLAVPGCNTVKPEWLAPLAGRNVILLYDNDYEKVTPTGKTIRPGWDGMKRFYKEAMDSHNPPASIQCIDWPSNLPDGYDVRDLFTSNLKVKKPT